MKKKTFIPYILVLIIMAVVFTGCMDDGKDKDVDKDPVEKPIDSGKSNDSKDEDSASEEDGKIIEEFRITSKTSPAPDVLIKFIDENIEKVSTKDADEMIDTLEMSLGKNMNVYQVGMSELDTDNELLEIDGSETEFQETSIERIKNEELKREVKYLYSNMYKLINVEGGFYPIINYDKLKAYDKYISDEWKDYIDIRSMDSDDRPMSDGALTISFEELQERIFKTEDYLKDYPKSNRKEDILKEYEYKISAYLKGLPNTPIMDYKTKKVNKKVLENYKETVNKKYEISNIVKEYVKAIEDNDNIIDAEVLKKADELIIKALSDVSIE